MLVDNHSLQVATRANLEDRGGFVTSDNLAQAEPKSRDAAVTRSASIWILNSHRNVPTSA
ncbi:hypothetical protein FA13DRAFT_1735110 [Coprinellus micaceus]|uniref:Uncharacterized protein n=1 Tax=Coprinellus micaceus TaxID=71717 RepID=A0A4Y7T490_COPMI|nr:hypothetical protein FA13DRAFT_1735110 [Coprinellus micaceus]